MAGGNAEFQEVTTGYEFQIHHVSFKEFEEDMLQNMKRRMFVSN